MSLTLALAQAVLALAALLAAWGVHSEPWPGSGPARPWQAVALALGLLALATALQPEYLLVRALRALAQHGGWYALRRPLQAAALAALLGAVLLAWLRLRHHLGPTLQGWPRRLRASLLGCALLALLLAVRMISWHPVDQLLASHLNGLFSLYGLHGLTSPLSLGRALELAALALPASGLAAQLAGQWRWHD